jgi:hypothetical protein
MYFSCTLLAYANHTKGIISLAIGNCQYFDHKKTLIFSKEQYVYLQKNKEIL